MSMKRWQADETPLNQWLMGLDGDLAWKMGLSSD